MSAAGNEAGAGGRSGGFTLMEVLVYAVLTLALMGLAVWSVAGAQKGARRNQEMSRLRGDAGEAVRILAQDARNLGLKHIVYAPSPGSLADTVLTTVEYGPADSSSFLHGNGNPYDTLAFLKPRLNAVGKPIQIDTVRYAVNASSSLIRTVNGAQAQEICRQVDAVQYEYGVFAAKTQLALQNPPLAAQWSQAPAGVVTQSGASIKASVSAAGTASFWLTGSPVTLNANHTYELELKAMANTAFLGHVDSMFAILCNAAGTPLAKQAFLPPGTLGAMTLEWGGVACAACYCGFQMKMNGAGEFNLSTLRLTDIAQGDGPWTAAPTLAQKRGIRAIRIFLLTRSNRDMHGFRADTLQLADLGLRFGDKFAHSLIQDIIAIPNNGN